MTATPAKITEPLIDVKRLLRYILIIIIITLFSQFTLILELINFYRELSHSHSNPNLDF